MVLPIREEQDNHLKNWHHFLRNSVGCVAAVNKNLQGVRARYNDFIDILFTPISCLKTQNNFLDEE